MPAQAGIQNCFALGPRFRGDERLRELRRFGARALLGLPDQVADLAPHRRLGNEVNVRVGILLPALALQDPAGLSAAGIVSGARHRLAERHAFTELAVFLERPVREALLVAQLDPRQIENAVLHGAEHPLSPPGAYALVERGDDAKRE